MKEQRPASRRQSAMPDPEMKERLPQQPIKSGHPLRPWLISLGLLAALTLAMFGNVLFSARRLVLSSGDESDLALEYLGFFRFGFGEMRHGILPLWNPHLFSGVPMLGAFESGLLYPLNALFLFLPLQAAVNWSIALHVFLAGAFTYAWAVRRGWQPSAGFLSAVMFMFCGANFLHVYSGSFPLLCTLAWVPLLFLSIDEIFANPSPGWTLTGMFAVAMQILAGAPQLVFYTGLAAGLYCLLRFWKEPNRFRIAMGLAGIVTGAIALTVIQLLPGLAEVREMVRSKGVPYDYAAMFSFPPENFLTLLAPNFFGDIQTVSYWGRCYLWEMSAFVSITGFFFALAGAVSGERRQRRIFVIMIVGLAVLALGAHTPLFKLLYHWAPGFDKFRGNSKFFILISLFLAMLAGNGFNEWAKGRRLSPWLTGGMVGVGLFLICGATAIHHSCVTPAGWWHSLMCHIRDAGESYLAPANYDDPNFILRAGHLAAQSLLIGGVTCLLVGLLAFRIPKNKTVPRLLLTLAIGELFVFAHNSLDSFDIAQTEQAELKQFLDAHPGDYRILDLRNNDAALAVGGEDIWGYNPAVQLRYAELVSFTQGVPPERATQYIDFSRDHPLFDLLRCRFVFLPRDNRLVIRERTHYLPHLLLISQYRVLTNREEILSALTGESFNSSQEVILETQPNPQPQSTADAGSAKIVDSSINQMTIEADVNSPTILLITDTYAKGWRADALPGSAQTHYTILPADYCLRGIPLSAGKHFIRMEYQPAGFVVGKWISIISLVIFFGLAGREAWRKFRRATG